MLDTTERLEVHFKTVMAHEVGYHDPMAYTNAKFILRKWTQTYTDGRGNLRNTSAYAAVRVGRGHVVFAAEIRTRLDLDQPSRRSHRYKARYTRMHFQGDGVPGRNRISSQAVRAWLVAGQARLSTATSFYSQGLFVDNFPHPSITPANRSASSAA